MCAPSSCRSWTRGGISIGHATTTRTGRRRSATRCGGKYGSHVNIFLVRIDPDGKKSDGSKPTLEECAEVTVGCLRAQHAKAAALSEERAALVDNGKEVPVGRCFISRRFFVPDNLQLINENALCEEDFRFINEDA